MSCGCAPTGNSETCPLGVILPTKPALSANQRLPSGPGTIPVRDDSRPAGSGNSVACPEKVTRTIARVLPVLPVLLFVNQRLPSDPETISPVGQLPVSTGNSLTCPPSVTRPTRPSLRYHIAPSLPAVSA